MTDNCKPKLSKVNTRLDAVEARLNNVDAKLDRIEAVLERNTALVDEHIRRTNILEGEVKDAKEHRESTLNTVIKLTERARKDQLATIKTTLGIFAAIAILITAIGGWLSYSKAAPVVQSVIEAITATPTP